MKKRAAVMVGAAILTGLAGCMDLNEDVISGLTPGAYGTEAAFQALVNATYEPLRSFWAQERGFTLTEFGTDIYTKGADGSYKFVNDYTTQLNPTVDYFTNTWNDFYRAINTANAALGQASIVQMDSTLKVKRVAEVRVLPGLYYFYLVELLGPPHVKMPDVTARRDEEPLSREHRPLAPRSTHLRYIPAPAAVRRRIRLPERAERRGHLVGAVHRRSADHRSGQHGTPVLPDGVRRPARHAA